MRAEKRRQKKQDIAEAAYALIEEKGYLGTSMLAIAKRAKASNETLYNWYGDKQGLFKELIEQNAEQVRTLLQSSTHPQCSPEETLVTLGPILLKLLLSERAIALNRAAAADPTGELGHALSAAGRETVFPMIVKLFSDLGPMDNDQALETAQTYLNLLVGDQQIRRAIGTLAEPTSAEIDARADKAMILTKKLFNFS
ncbi:TetR/AcrR family transcriptional regulator [Maritalea porphyrae]|jgi:AcrR family transcriptional regulator|uniref:TetR/AcrR family transcriptional regulator n=1 Tax=Maritalea porphyrae TaxID=880732 RepID=UPI0022B02DF5|nr:TetR/AcrR family transcriptional regulator [Maritalea porphyrae]MCZ4272355.1 TetR/AcrR family transcriptional regulator [Maritalea porphyrae]